MRLEPAADKVRALAAHAYQADATIEQALDCGDADTGLQALFPHFGFGQRQQDCAAHDFAARFAAATASRALE
ncbi:hypothetical protein [Sphingomonas sp. F9_3S_D5_B_2]